MSLILEALRKSEAERRRGLAPDVAMELPPTQAPRPRMPAAWWLPALVVAALLVVAGWWARPEPATVTSPQAAADTIPNTTSSVSNPLPPGLPRIQPKPPAPPMASVPATTAGSVTATPPPPVATTRSAPAQPFATQPDPAPPPAVPASDISNDTSTLPPIKLSMHMWDEVPSKRFVILNGQRMAEGDHSGALTVISIERNGVVVESNGSRARVPLP
ncbi:MAG: general secretion pathway protein GspB [Thermomonas sp.]